MKTKSLNGILERELKELINDCRQLRAEIGAIGNAIARLSREIQLQTEVIVHGAETVRPWDKLPEARRKAVERVVAYMRENRESTKSRAAKATFEPAEGGYPNSESLAAYLYGVNLAPFL